MPLPLRIRGVNYPSKVAAARALGLNLGTISKHLEAGTLDYAGLKKGETLAKSIVIDGVKYRSINNASRMLGVSWRIAKRMGEVI